MRSSIFSLTLLFLLSACSSGPQSETPAASSKAEIMGQTIDSPLLPNTGEPAMHAVQNAKLQEIMKEINALLYLKMLNEVDLSKENRLRNEEIAKIAKQLAANQTAVMGTLPSLNLNPTEEAAFSSLASKLRVAAEQMETLAVQNQIQALPSAMETITSTCTSCHTLFRKNRNILERCKDPKSTC